jgi:hypothetical protein
MKRLLIIALSIFTLSSFAQTDSTKKKLDCYLAGSLSTSTGNNFNQNSYAGIELGVCAKNMMFGYATGRGNLDFTSDMTENYWGEIKAYACHQFGSVKGYVLGGWGQYYKTTHSFIEYGGGASYSVKKFDLSITVSNWDNVWYISPGVCFNFGL